MNILVLSYEYPPIGGGAGRVMEALANHWTAAGHQVTVLSGGLGAETETVQQGLLRLIRVPCGRSLAYRSNPWQMMRWARSAWRYLLEHKLAQPVVVANFMMPGGWVAHRLYRRWAWPYLIVTHGHDVPGAAPEEMRWYHAALRPVLRTVGRQAKGLVALNPELYELLLKFLPEQRECIWLLPNGLDRVQIADKGPGRGTMRMVWAGRLVEQKRPDLVLRAVAELPFPFKLDLFGDGPLRRSLEKTLTGHPKRGSIQIRGFVPREVWLDCLGKADVLLHTARFEAMSLVQLEACSCGVYVISSAVQGTGPWLEPGVNGELLSTDNEEAWQNALSSFYNERFIRGFSYTPGYAARLQERLGWEGIAERYGDLLREIHRGV